MSAESLAGAAIRIHSPMTGERTQRILAHLWPGGNGRRGMRIFAALDGARDNRIEPLVRRSGQEYRCLYSGALSPRLAAAAPYLLALPSPRTSVFTQEVLELAWGQSWGIFLESAAPLVDLRRHFRGFLRVKDEAGKFLIFRWYDPRVLRVYLPTCTAEELTMIFGPVDRYVVEGDSPDALIEYRPGRPEHGQPLRRSYTLLTAPGEITTASPRLDHCTADSRQLW